MNRQFGFPHGLRSLAALILGAAFCVLFTPPAWAASTLTVNNAIACNDTAPTTVYCTIQAAIDAAAPGDTINVYPGSYNETAPNRTILVGTPKEQGPHQFGLFIAKGNLTIQGVNASGQPLTGVPQSSMVMPEVTTNATNNYGPSGIWVEGDNVTISGLRVLNNVSGENKTIEVVGNAFTLKHSHINVTGGGSVYLNDWLYDSATPKAHVESYTIESNLFDKGASLDIASGPGATGPVAGRKIIGNVWEDAPTADWALISFSGSSVVPWYTYPVGGAIITGNQFGLGQQFIRARGTYVESEFDWTAYWTNNTFAKAAVVGANPPADVRTYSYNTSYGNMVNVRRIGGMIQGEIDNAQPGDTVLVKAGLYEENLTVNKHVKLVGAGSGSDTASNTVIRQVSPSNYSAAVLLSGSGASVADPLLLEHLRIELAGWYGIHIAADIDQAVNTPITVQYLRLNDVQVVGDAAAHGENEMCLRLGKRVSLAYLDVQNSGFSRCDHGWYFYKVDYPAGGSYARNINVRNTTFADNSYKGLYLEKLSDASFDNVQVLNNGSDPNWNSPWNGGMDINLKGQEAYQNLTLRNLTVTGNGKGYRHGAGLMLKARDDASSYNTYPASLTNVLIEGGVFTGNERGIRLGEPGKNNAGPTNVQVHGASLFGNVKTYTGTDGSAYGDLINYSLATIDATGNWWGVATGPVTAGVGMASIASTDPGVIYASNGPVLYEPFLNTPLTNKTLEVPSFGLILPDSQDKIQVPVRFNPGTDALSALQFNLEFDPACLSVANDSSVSRGNSLLVGHQLPVIERTAGKLKISVVYNDGTETLQALLPGTLLTVEFTIANTPACRSDRTVPITFAASPAPSFGTTGAVSVPGTTQDGVITLDFNQPATAINLTPNRVYEGMPAGEAVGTLSVADPDAWETFTYELATGGTHNALFTIDGNQVKAVGPYSYDTPVLTIKVTATGSGGSEITQDLTIDVADYSTLSLPAPNAYLWGKHTSTVAVPVQVTKRSNDVTAAKFNVSYDTTCLAFVNTTGLPSGWTDTGSGGSGTVTVNMSGSPALTDGSTIAQLNFNVTYPCGAYPAPLTLSAVELSDADGRVSARSNNGAVYVIKNDARGDCNSDAKVDAADFAAVVLEVFDADTGRLTPSHWLEAPRPAFPGSPLGCNANGSGTPPSDLIEIGDLVCTVNIVFGNLVCTGGAGTASIASAETAAATATLAQGQAVAANGVLEVPVALQSNGNAVAAFAFTLSYDPARYTLDTTDADQDGIADAVAFQVPANIVRWAFVKADEGKLQLAAAGLQAPLPTLADGQIVSVRLTPRAGANGADIRIQEASLGNTAGFGVPVVVVGPAGADSRIFLPAISQ